MTKAVIINGGNSITSRLTGVHQEVERIFEKESGSFQSIYVHQLPAEALITADFANEEIQAANQLVEEAEIIVILTTIYKAAYTGILKTYLDLLPQKAFERKKIVPIAVGGSIAHLLAVEYSLKPVLSTLGATEISNSVYIVDKQVQRLEGNVFKIEEDAEERLKAVLRGLLPAKL